MKRKKVLSTALIKQNIMISPFRTNVFLAVLIIIAGINFLHVQNF